MEPLSLARCFSNRLVVFSSLKQAKVWQVKTSSARGFKANGSPTSRMLSIALNGRGCCCTCRLRYSLSYLWLSHDKKKQMLEGQMIIRRDSASDQNPRFCLSRELWRFPLWTLALQILLSRLNKGNEYSSNNPTMNGRGLLIFLWSHVSEHDV